MPVKLFHNTILVSPIVIKKDFCLREEVYLIFFSKINNFITKKAIRHFQVNIKNAVKHMDYVY